MNHLIEVIRQELIDHADEKTRLSFSRFFREEVHGYGVKTHTVEKIAGRYWQKIKEKGKEVIFSLCEELLRTDVMEEAFVVSMWGKHFNSFIVPEDMETYARWINLYINNWAKCDSFCNHAVGDLLTLFPHKADVLGDWARSDNRWMRRAAAVSLIMPAKKGEFLHKAIEIASIMLTDKDDMVQKGYGWLLKEESRKHRQEIFDYVMRNKCLMPRTSLRYAIELMPLTMRRLAMAR